jgi:hypothetical protein
MDHVPGQSDHDVRSRRTKLACLSACALAFGLATLPCPAFAAESPLPVTPPGSTDIDQALLPPRSGLYIGFFSLPYSANVNTYDSGGNKLPGAYGIRDSTQLFGAAALYVYPWHPLGTTIGSTFAQPTQNLTTSIGDGPSKTQFGFSDAFSDVLFASKYVGLVGARPGNLRIPYGLTVAAAFSLVIPDGRYDVDDDFKLSGHSWVIDPNVSLTYNAGRLLPFGDNTQFSTRFFYAVPTRDFTTHYQTGHIIDDDWSVTEQFGSFRVGLSGYYQKQITDDSLPDGGTPPGGNKFADATIGPIGEYFFPNGMFVKAKYDYTFYHVNYIDQRFILVETGFKF